MIPNQTKTKDLLENSLKKKDIILYDNIWNDLNLLLADRCIADGIVELPIIGELRIVRVKHTVKILSNGFANIPVNWGKTKKARKEGIIGPDKVIYSNIKNKVKVKWTRPRAVGISAYSFKPSRTNGIDVTCGFSNKLFSFLKESDTNYLKFPLIK